MVEHFRHVSTDLLEVSNGKESFEFEGGYAQFSHDGKRLLTRREIPDVQACGLWLWNVPNRKSSLVIRVDEEEFWPGFTPNDSGLEISTSRDMRVLDAKDGSEPQRFDVRGYFSPDRDRFLSREAGGAQIWDVQSGWIVREMKGGTRTGCWHPDGRHVLTAPVLGSEPYVRLWGLRRPEHWWGIAWLPQFWLTILFACLLAWSVWRDRKTL